MTAQEIIMWVVIGLVGLGILAYAIYMIVKIAKMTPEERKQTLVTYLKGAVALAEQQIGSGNGEIKLAQVEDYFNKNAPWFLKILLTITGKSNLKELIELALSEIKENFGTTNTENN